MLKTSIKSNIVLLLICFLVFIYMNGCISTNPILGKWSSDEDTSIEFFRDGTVNMSGQKGVYQIFGHNNLYISVNNETGESVSDAPDFQGVYDYMISGHTLTLKNKELDEDWVLNKCPGNNLSNSDVLEKIDMAKQIKCKSNFRKLIATLEVYCAEKGIYPQSLEELVEDELIGDEDLYCPAESGEKYNYIQESESAYILKCPVHNHSARNGIFADSF